MDDPKTLVIVKADPKLAQMAKVSQLHLAWEREDGTLDVFWFGKSGTAFAWALHDAITKIEAPIVTEVRTYAESQPMLDFRSISKRH
jgi:hypothetical protein